MTNDTKMYGVWQPGKGWLRGSDVFADPDIDKAKQVARLIGNNAVVRFIDKSIVDLEQYYLENERKSLWNKLISRWLNRQQLDSSEKITRI